MTHRPTSYRRAATAYHRPFVSAAGRGLGTVEALPVQHEGVDPFLKAEVPAPALFVISEGMRAAAARGRRGQNPFRQHYSAAY